jgi:hypothetical protein
VNGLAYASPRDLTHSSELRLISGGPALLDDPWSIQLKKYASGGFLRPPEASLGCNQTS